MYVYAAISIGEELINLFLKNHIDNQTQHELFCCIGHITLNFRQALFSMKLLDAETSRNYNDFYRIDAVVSMFKDSSVRRMKEVRHH